MTTIHPEPDHVPEIPARYYPPRLHVGEARTCRVCGRAIQPDARVHVCTACRVRKTRGALLGPACEACGKSRMRVLCLRPIEGRRATLCGDCANILGRRPLTLAALAAEAAA